MYIYVYMYMYVYMYVYIYIYREIVLQSVVHTLSFLFAWIGTAQGGQTAAPSSSICVRGTPLVVRN